jgi:trans-2,3-dihydro-3-hydroxyanthranilate isomerase
VFEEKAGLVPIQLLVDGGKCVGAELTAPEPLTRCAMAPIDQVADCLALGVEDLTTTQPQVISVGLPFLVAELKTRDALRRARPNLAAHERLLPLDGADAIYVFTRDVANSGASCDLMSRMFAPLDGIPEDPATGSATAALAAVLAEERKIPDAETRLRVLQGVDMGRPSLLHTRVSRRAGRPVSVHVGGQCVPVMEGILELLDHAG